MKSERVQFRDPSRIHQLKFMFFKTPWALISITDSEGARWSGAADFLRPVLSANSENCYFHSFQFLLVNELS